MNRKKIAEQLSLLEERTEMLYQKVEENPGDTKLDYALQKQFELLANAQEKLEKMGYFQGTSDPDEDKSERETLTDEERRDRDTRHPVKTYMWFTNYDYTPDGPDQTSPGGSPYHGAMDRFTSIKQFLDQRRKENDKKKAEADDRIAKLTKIALGK